MAWRLFEVTSCYAEILGMIGRFAWDGVFVGWYRWHMGSKEIKKTTISCDYVDISQMSRINQNYI